jgi:hypothetical protein
VSDWGSIPLAPSSSLHLSIKNSISKCIIRHLFLNSPGPSIVLAFSFAPCIVAKNRIITEVQVAASKSKLLAKEYEETATNGPDFLWRTRENIVLEPTSPIRHLCKPFTSLGNGTTCVGVAKSDISLNLVHATSGSAAI